MQTLRPEYLAEIARQIGSLSAFLGGFAAAFFGTLLALNSPQRTISWALVSAAFASMAFVVAVVACTNLVIILHPQAPTSIAPESGGARVLAVLGFLLGAYALLLSIGLSGWLRSRRMGVVTSGLATGAGLLVTWLVISL
ncbi:hypothetical protein [Spirosoma flavum]|uniref:Uncharacterized protein n=1 Tax=Spirosoma flavum TaxID=2048557 RepID=A0ABW6AER7_9BACT